MVRQDQWIVELRDVQSKTLLVEVWTPAGRIEIMGEVERVGRVLYVTGTHINGPRPGVLGRSGLNAIGQTLMEAADVDEIVIEGSTRTTGRMAGRAPRTIRFPHT
jgi:hypothetical protein